MFKTTTITVRQSRRNKKHHQPGEDGAEQPFLPTSSIGLSHIGRLIEFEAQVDILAATRPSIRGKAAFTSFTTDRVEASARLVTSMKDSPPAVHQGLPVGMSVPSSILATSRR